MREIFCTKISLIEGNICRETSLIEGFLWKLCYNRILQYGDRATPTNVFMIFECHKSKS